jgi:hypothetical protein
MTSGANKMPSPCRDGNTRHYAVLELLERFPAKWTPVRVKKTRQIKNLEPRSDSIGTEKALVRAVMFGVVTARLVMMLFGVAGMAMRGMGVVGGLLVVAGIMVLGGFAMMLGGMLVMFGGLVVMFDGVLAHSALPAGG